MEHLIVVALGIAFVALLGSRVHFHFSLNLTISRRGAETVLSRKGGVRDPRQRDSFDANANRATIRREPVRSLASGADRQQKAGKVSGEASPSQLADLKSALVNLGCRKQQAAAIAARAIESAPDADFDVLLKWAIREAA